MGVWYRNLEIVGFDTLGELTTTTWSDRAYEMSSPSTWGREFIKHGAPAIAGMDSQAFEQQWDQLREVYNSIDQVVSIERAGRASDGHYYTMSAKDMVQHLSAANVIFEWANMDGDLCTLVAVID